MDLNLIEVNRRKTRKAYIDKNGSIYLEWGKCKEIKSIDDYYDHKHKGWFGKKTDCKQCSSLPAKKKREECRNNLLKETVTINGDTELSMKNVSFIKIKMD